MIYAGVGGPITALFGLLIAFVVVRQQFYVKSDRVFYHVLLCRARYSGGRFLHLGV